MDSVVETSGGLNPPTTFDYSVYVVAATSACSYTESPQPIVANMISNFPEVRLRYV